MFNIAFKIQITFLLSNLQWILRPFFYLSYKFGYVFDAEHWQYYQDDLKEYGYSSMELTIISNKWLDVWHDGTFNIMFITIKHDSIVKSKHEPFDKSNWLIWSVEEKDYIEDRKDIDF